MAPTRGPWTHSWQKSFICSYLNSKLAHEVTGKLVTKGLGHWKPPDWFQLWNPRQDQFRFLSVLRQEGKTNFAGKSNGFSGEVERSDGMPGFSKPGGWNQIWKGIGELDLASGSRRVPMGKRNMDPLPQDLRNAVRVPQLGGPLHQGPPSRWRVILALPDDPTGRLPSFHARQPAGHHDLDGVMG
jgi:hypothetical protein